MKRLPIPGRPELAPILPTPTELETSTVEMVARAQYCGLGFRRDRPYPLVGDYYAGMFVHYRPVHLTSSGGTSA